MTDMWTITAQGPKRAIQKAADVLAWADPSPATAVSHFEVMRFTWRLEALSEDEAAAKDAVALCNQTAPDIEWRIAPLVQEDWIAKSLEGLPAVPVGRFVVAGEHAAPKAGAYRRLIRIEAGEAFGTGHHGTTKGCIQSLSLELKRKRPQRVLDIGTGSGVLALAALKTGVPYALGTDLDKESVRIAHENRKNNKVGRRFKLLHARGAGHALIRSGAPYDLVLANILAKPLVGLAPEIARLVKPGGRIILSGLLTHQEPQVKAAYAGQGLHLTNRRRLNGWSTLTYARAG